MQGSQIKTYTGADPEILQGWWLERVRAYSVRIFWPHPRLLALRIHISWVCARLRASGCWTNLFQHQWILSIGSHRQSSSQCNWRDLSNRSHTDRLVAALATTDKGLGPSASIILCSRVPVIWHSTKCEPITSNGKHHRKIYICFVWLDYWCHQLPNCTK